MQTLNIISLILIISLNSCIGRQNNDIEKAKELVKQGNIYANSDIAKSRNQKLNSEKKLTLSLEGKIDSFEDINLINRKDQVLEISSALIHTLDKSTALIEEKHGKNVDGSLKNKMDASYINLIFIQNKRAEKIKISLLDGISKFNEIAIQNKFEIHDLPLQLNLFMEEEGQTWEEYNFKDMPAIAILPIIQKYKNDIILTKLLLLEELINKN